ncbi:hypothetical protein ElyMa_002088700 [Elysia marginata]|uniref:Uncharacterized protein n=1 Tax=Elysia marginata TaxID=1093978 RepID=A0AAV4FEF5_9GAST|nr:hypothetical protein ElyMa_002088700 [Elysia marginata]
MTLPSPYYDCSHLNAAALSSTSPTALSSMSLGTYPSIMTLRFLYSVDENDNDDGRDSNDDDDCDESEDNDYDDNDDAENDDDYDDVDDDDDGVVIIIMRRRSMRMIVKKKIYLSSQHSHVPF